MQCLTLCASRIPDTVARVNITGQYPELVNSSLAEQKNATLRRLAGQLAYMSQRMALSYVRTVLYFMNETQQAKRRGECFYL
jgi:hypothetical protein